MGLETVVEDIREQAREEAAKIREAAEEDAAEIVADAEADAEEVIAARERAVERQIEQEREQARSSAKLEASQARLGTKRDLLDDLRTRLEERIRSLEGDRRAELTRALLASAVEEYPEDLPLTVRGSPDDEALLKELVESFESAEYEGTIDVLGGVVVGSDQSRITIDNSFDAILDRMWEENLKGLSALLFDQDQ